MEQDDAARIQALIDNVVYLAEDILTARRLAEQLVAVAAAAAYRHAAEYMRNVRDCVHGVAGERRRIEQCDNIAKFFDAWAQQAEDAQKGATT